MGFRTRWVFRVACLARLQFVRRASIKSLDSGRDEDDEGARGQDLSPVHHPSTRRKHPKRTNKNHQPILPAQRLVYVYVLTPCYFAKY